MKQAYAAIINRSIGMTINTQSRLGTALSIKRKKKLKLIKKIFCLLTQENILPT